MSYREWQVQRSPVWLQDEDGAALEGELGGIKDSLADRIRDGVLARFPDFGATDSQDAVGDDRLLPRGYRQNDPDYATRLKQAWDHWPGTEDAPGGAGSHAGMLRELQVQGFFPALIVQDNGRYTTLDTNGDLVVGWLGSSATRGRPDWRFVDRDDFYSRFAIVFPGPLPPLVQITATAHFNNSDRATAVWSQAWDDSNYMLALSSPITTDPVPVIVADFATQLDASIELTATAAFTGTVDLLSWIPGTCPFASPSVSSANKLRELARLWKPGKMTYAGAVAIVEGGLWGWPLGTWGEPGDIWDLNTAVLIE